jgi:hypothetical protein
MGAQYLLADSGWRLLPGFRVGDFGIRKRLFTSVILAGNGGNCFQFPTPTDGNGFQFSALILA